jgi:hypothetical protein
MGNVNRYNASGSGSGLSITLPALGPQNVGAITRVEKDSLDASFLPITLTAGGSDTFDDGATSMTLIRAGEKREIQVVSISGVKYWKSIGGFIPRGNGIVAATSQFSLTNSTTATQIIGTSALTSLGASATYRIQLCGEIQFASSSGTLTFTPFVVNTALAQTCQMPSQGSSGGPVAFDLRYMITVYTSGTSGTAIAKPFGMINTSAPIYLTSASTSTTTINTTSTSAPIVGVNATWQTASASNSLLVDIATIERIV